MVTAAPEGFLLGLTHQTRSHALPAQRFWHNQHLDIQPTIAGDAPQPTLLNRNPQYLMPTSTRYALVVRYQLGSNYLPDGIIILDHGLKR
jgi:hypothetical protein